MVRISFNLSFIFFKRVYKFISRRFIFNIFIKYERKIYNFYLVVLKFSVEN